MKFSSTKINAGFGIPLSTTTILAFQFCAGWCPSTSELEKTVDRRITNGLTKLHKYKEIVSQDLESWKGKSLQETYNFGTCQPVAMLTQQANVGTGFVNHDLHSAHHNSNLKQTNKKSPKAASNDHLSASPLHSKVGFAVRSGTFLQRSF